MDILTPIPPEDLPSWRNKQVAVVFRDDIAAGMQPMRMYLRGTLRSVNPTRNEVRVFFPDGSVLVTPIDRVIDPEQLHTGPHIQAPAL